MVIDEGLLRYSHCTSEVHLSTSEVIYTSKQCWTTCKLCSTATGQWVLLLITCSVL